MSQERQPSFNRSDARIRVEETGSAIHGVYIHSRHIPTSRSYMSKRIVVVQRNNIS